jgi:hypothetical protein
VAPELCADPDVPDNPDDPEAPCVIDAVDPDPPPVVERDSLPESPVSRPIAPIPLRPPPSSRPLMRRRLWTCFTPEESSARSSAIRFIQRSSTVPLERDFALDHHHVISDASMSPFSSRRSLISSLMRSSER